MELGYGLSYTKGLYPDFFGWNTHTFGYNPLDRG